MIAFLDQRGDGVRRACPRRLQYRALLRFEHILRAFGHQTRSRELCHDALALGHAVHRLGDDLTDHGGFQIPLGQNRTNIILVTELGDDEHPFLRFRQQDLVRRHALLAHWHLRHVDGNTDIPALRHFG